MYEEPKGLRSRKRKRKGKKNSQHGKPQKRVRETAVERLQSEGETESGDNVSSFSINYHIVLL